MKFLLSSSVVILGVMATGNVFASAQYPAANFQPRVIYSAEGLSSAAAAEPVKAAVVEKTAFDPRYPAAYFEPKVIYPPK